MRKGAPVAIAGAGVISAIGNNVAECLTALEQGQAGMGPITGLDTALRGQLPVAEVKMANAAPLSRTTLLAFIAAKEALDSAAIPDLSSWRTGIVSANTVGGMDLTEKFFADAGIAPAATPAGTLAQAAARQGRLRDIVQHECG